MVTKEQAMTAQSFHSTMNHDCTKVVGPRGGVKVTIERWRRSGATKTWKTRPEEFQVPIKYGMYESDYLNQNNAHQFHVASECEVEPY